MNALLISGGKYIRDTLRATFALRLPDATVIEAEDGASGIAMARGHLPDIIILDVVTPDMDGFDVCARLHDTVHVPILMLTVMERDEDKVRGLEAGADDYLVRPFDHFELMARVRALLRRGRTWAERSVEGVLTAGQIELCVATRTVSMGCRSARLTNKESSILTILLRHLNRTVSHRVLMAGVWGPELVDETHYLKLYIHNLRRKLVDIGCQPNIITSQRAVGYRFTGPAESGPATDLEELESIRTNDAVTCGGREAAPLDQAIDDIEHERG
jgi:two-component system KDP operon response regulator KdpE